MASPTYTEIYFLCYNLYLPALLAVETGRSETLDFLFFFKEQSVWGGKGIQGHPVRLKCIILFSLTSFLFLQNGSWVILHQFDKAALPLLTTKAILDTFSRTLPPLKLQRTLELLFKLAEKLMTFWSNTSHREHLTEENS